METKNVIRVFIVDDDLGWLKSLTFFLNNHPALFVCATATSKNEAVDLAQRVQFDIILMDINLAGNRYDGIYATLEICNLKKAKIIMVTSLDEDKIVTNSFLAGAVNIINKLEYEKIPDAIRDALQSNSPFEQVLQDYIRLNKEKCLTILTLAEQEIFSYLEQGFTPSQITIKLNKAESTLKNQINSILRKLEVKSCKEAVEKVKWMGITL